MTDSLWELRDVCLGRGPRARLDRVSCVIPHGATAVMGASGAGKTSLLNLLTQFEVPDSGQIQCVLPADRLPIAWVPPDFGLWSHLTVLEHVEIVRGSRSQASPSSTLLKSFGLDELAQAPVGQLSQGERSRLAIARALACDPAVLVMDEPLVHVDPMALERYWTGINEHCQARETSLVFSTHSPDVVLREATTVLCLEAGKLTYHGPVATLYYDPPSPGLARFLGPANWFDVGEAATWIRDWNLSADRMCCRPEQLEVTPDESGLLRVQSSHQIGTIVESQLEHVTTSETRTIRHRVGPRVLSAGSRVLLHYCAVLLICLMWSGCQDSSAGPDLAVTGFRTFKMPPDGSSVPAPRSLTASPDGELYVLDNAGRVLVYTADGTLDRQWHMPEFDVGKPEGICILSDGTVAVADTHYHRIVVFDPQGQLMRMFGEHGEAPGQFIYPVAITRDNSGHIYVAEYGGNDRIQKFTEAGELVTTFGSFGTDQGQFQRPSGIVWIAEETGGALFIADAINNRVHVYSDNGEFRDTIVDSASDGAISVEYPYDIALSPHKTLFLAEYGAGRVTEITLEGALVGRYGGVGRGSGQFYTPWGIAVDSRGRVYVADTGNHRTVELSL